MGVLRHREVWGPGMERTLPEPLQEVLAAGTVCIEIHRLPDLGFFYCNRVSQTLGISSYLHDCYHLHYTISSIIHFFFKSCSHKLFTHKCHG